MLPLVCRRDSWRRLEHQLVSFFRWGALRRHSFRLVAGADTRAPCTDDDEPRLVEECADDLMQQLIDPEISRIGQGNTAHEGDCPTTLMMKPGQSGWAVGLVGGTGTNVRDWPEFSVTFSVTAGKERANLSGLTLV